MVDKYDIEFKKKIVRLFLEEGRTTKKSISNEFSVSVASISNWVKQFREEYQISKKANDEYNYMKENLRLRKELEEAKKENIKNKIKEIYYSNFTYLKLTDGTFRYNCSILDLYDRSIVASITAREMTSELAIKTLEKALRKVKKIRNKIILHSNQGSQYSSKKFVEYCKKNIIQQSMSRAGCPYDNAPMERYFNTLKNELINHYYYKTEKEIYESIEEFAYVWYNHIRPYSYNDYMTPYEKRRSFRKVNKEINFN